MGFVDLHVHSTCSADGRSSIAEYVQRAAVLGLGEVGFCEHVDFDPRDWDYGYLDLNRYEQELGDARLLDPGVQMRHGVEIAYQNSREEEIGDWLAAHTWDYVVASIHLLDYADGWAMVSEQRTTDAYFASHGQREAYVPYFEELLQAARSGLADVLGHLDLVKRYGTAHYGPFDPAAFEDEIRAVLQAAIDVGVGLEVNTSGLRQGAGEPYPGLTVLRWYREIGGEIVTVGSDAHHADNLGAGIAETLDLVREAGFQAVASFEARRLRWIDL
jgi:histidinol-phosphatase (PHP family)